MNFKKLLFLFLALLLPVLIFIFLKSFGKNEFAVAPLFTDKVEAPVACAAYKYTYPYTVADSVLQKLFWNKIDSISIVITDDAIEENKHLRAIQLERIFTEFPAEKLKVIYLVHAVDTSSSQQSNPRLVQVMLQRDRLLEIKGCVLLLSRPNDAAIIDSKGRIMGQYNLLDREDADRMIMQEMNILFKRY